MIDFKTQYDLHKQGKGNKYSQVAYNFCLGALVLLLIVGVLSGLWWVIVTGFAIIGLIFATLFFLLPPVLIIVAIVGCIVIGNSITRT